MKKLIQLLGITVFGICLLTSCNEKLVGSGKIISENRPIAAISGVENNGNFKVIITKSHIASMTLCGEDNVIPEIVTEVRHNKLIIWYRHYNMQHAHQQVVINITTPDIELLSVSGAGTIESSSVWTTAELFTHVSGSGQIDIFTKATSLKGNTSGAGEIILHGEADKSHFTASGKGKIQAYDLTTQEATADISGFGSVQLKAETYTTR